MLILQNNFASVEGSNITRRQILKRSGVLTHDDEVLAVPMKVSRFGFVLTGQLFNYTKHPKDRGDHTFEKVNLSYQCDFKYCGATPWDV